MTAEEKTIKLEILAYKLKAMPIKAILTGIIVYALEKNSTPNPTVTLEYIGKLFIMYGFISLFHYFAKEMGGLISGFIALIIACFAMEYLPKGGIWDFVHDIIFISMFLGGAVVDVIRFIKYIVISFSKTIDEE